MDLIVEIQVKIANLKTLAPAKKFSRAWQHWYFVYEIEVAIDAMHADVHKTAYLVYTTEKMHHVAATVTKNTLRWQI